MSGFLSGQDGAFIVSAPGDVRSYGVDWTNMLESDETLTDSAWITSAGLVQEGALVIGNICSCKIGSPSIGSYRVVNKVTTSLGQVLNRSFKIVVQPNI